jgi:hypothetical protein
MVWHDFLLALSLFFVPVSFLAVFARISRPGCRFIHLGLCPGCRVTLARRCFYFTVRSAGLQGRMYALTVNSLSLHRLVYGVKYFRENPKMTD